MYYAWSPIRYDVDRDTTDPTVITKVHTIAFGTEVTQEDLGVDDVEWKALLDGGAVRDYAPPKMPDTFQGSPIEFLRAEAEKAANLSLSGVGGYNIGGPTEEAMHLGVETNVPGVEEGTGPTTESAPPGGSVPGMS